MGARLVLELVRRGGVLGAVVALDSGGFWQGWEVPVFYHPWSVTPDLALDEMRSFAASPCFNELLYSLAYGEPQQGSPEGSVHAPLVIGWGRNDLVCFAGRRNGPKRYSLTLGVRGGRRGF